MNLDEVRKAAALIPKFVQMCENELGEVDHDIEDPLTWQQFELVERLINKLQLHAQYVDVNIFEDVKEERP